MFTSSSVLDASDSAFPTGTRPAYGLGSSRSRRVICFWDAELACAPSDRRVRGAGAHFLPRHRAAGRAELFVRGRRSLRHRVRGRSCLPALVPVAARLGAAVRSGVACTPRVLHDRAARRCRVDRTHGHLRGSGCDARDTRTVHVRLVAPCRRSALAGHNQPVTTGQPPTELERGLLLAVFTPGTDDAEELAEMEELARAAGV